MNLRYENKHGWYSINRKNIPYYLYFQFQLPTGHLGELVTSASRSVFIVYLIRFSFYSKKIENNPSGIKIIKLWD